MSSLVYHPFFDPSHCAFRLISLLYDCNQEVVGFDKLAIMDFYFLFPHLLKDIKLPAKYRGYKNRLKEVEPPFESTPNENILMYRLQLIQKQTIKCLVAKSLLDKNLFLSDKYLLLKTHLPNTLIEFINKSDYRHENWYDFLVKIIPNIDLLGPDGLKARTGLLEYRYDAI